MNTNSVLAKGVWCILKHILEHKSKKIIFLNLLKIKWRMRLSLVFGVCIAAGLVGLVTAQCNRNGDINGCSIPFGLPLPFKQKFTPSCYKHDVCYFCGAARAISRSRCDAKFLTDMENACRGIGNSQDREKCSKWANRYKGAVRLGGVLYYKKKPKNWCSESWVSGCLP
ncbi:hypothetical protein LOTGIDRAFT_176428 [Lottia gigantea]|uniref:Phospholipase A2 domain-containing protein n=1 Tax=Lottia gigantea TaxID=225164 RepID=V4ACY2_LOTGI|nr:hypothetical protein LOTGIDRAFT_176428 [Lottia gigantea]ESP01839.1 hypothetical protein LOTGIDRAFT_176428 [Lottia gigantea]